MRAILCDRCGDQCEDESAVFWFGKKQLRRDSETEGERGWDLCENCHVTILDLLQPTTDAAE